MDFNPVPFNFGIGLLKWLAVVAVVAVATLVLSWVASVARNGRTAGKRAFGRGLSSYLDDLGSLSLRRIMAISSLTFREAVRRRALLVFVVFAVLLMFAGWFISDANARPEMQVNVHITFVLTTIAWLILPAVIFLSCWGIPEDIRLRSMHTVVTKPARRVEIVMGRMLGFGSVTVLVLVVMGAIGYIWIQRQIPDSVRSRLTCRVPVFGEMYFLDVRGQPARYGVNVGDTWMYRSYIQGNSRARAVWLFQNITPATVGDVLKIESRFEAFRTVKGSEKSIKEGLEAQFTLVQNPREDAFGVLASGESVREFAEALREGQFRTAADKLTEFAGKVRAAPQEIPESDYFGLANGSFQADRVLEQIDPALAPLGELFGKLSRTTETLGRLKDTAGEQVYASIADDCDSVAAYLRDNAEDLHERMPRLEVSLPSFGVSEFHEGDNVLEIDRRIPWTADYETLSRFLSRTMDRLNEEGKLLDGAALSTSVTEHFEKAGPMSTLNAETLTSVLTEQLAAGVLRAEGGKLLPPAGKRWFTFFDDLVRKDQLASRDSEGWRLEIDLFEQLTKDGNLRIEVACLNDQMFLGMARPDLFLRLPDRPFLVGYIKAIFTTGLMLLLVVVIGVTASCVVKGPVSVFFTLTVFIVGQFFQEFLNRIVFSREKGLGLIESATLIFQHRNPSAGMDATEATQKLVRGIDMLSTGLLAVASQLIPNFATFSKAGLSLEKGFDVPMDSSVWPAIATFFAFLIPCVLLAGACLKFRELESK